MCSGGTPIEASAAAPSSAALVMVRQPTGVLLTSPKQPQPTSGRRVRNSARAATAVQNSTAVAARTASAGAPAPMRPAVTSRPTPRANSLTHDRDRGRPLQPEREHPGRPDARVNRPRAERTACLSRAAADEKHGEQRDLDLARYREHPCSTHKHHPQNTPSHPFA